MIPASSANGVPPQGLPSQQVPERPSHHANISSDFSPPAVLVPGKYNTAPGGFTKPTSDDFGYGRQDVHIPATIAGRANTSNTDTIPAELRPGVRQSGVTNNQNRFTVTNIVDSEHELNEVASSLASAAARPVRSQWLPAEEEKRRLYEKATAEVARVQGTSARLSTPLNQSPVCLHTKQRSLLLISFISLLLLQRPPLQARRQLHLITGLGLLPKRRRCDFTSKLVQMPVGYRGQQLKASGHILLQ